MMDCATYRKGLLAEPQHADAGMRAHAAGCHDCAQYTERLLRFESRLERAVRVSAPQPRVAGFAARRAALDGVWAPRPPRLRRGLAIAASVLVATVVAGGLWLAAAGPSLAAAVVSHMAGEPEAWRRSDQPVLQSALDQVLNESHVRLKPDAVLVSYASSCLFRGHQVPHLVVQTAEGPVTVMLLTQETLSSAVHFDEGGYRGVIVPVPGHGSLAVLERGPAVGIQGVEAVAQRVLGAVEYR